MLAVPIGAAPHNIGNDQRSNQRDKQWAKKKNAQGQTAPVDEARDNMHGVPRVAGRAGKSAASAASQMRMNAQGAGKSPLLGNHHQQRKSNPQQSTINRDANHNKFISFRKDQPQNASEPSSAQPASVVNQAEQNLQLLR